MKWPYVVKWDFLKILNYCGKVQYNFPHTIFTTLFMLLKFHSLRSQEDTIFYTDLILISQFPRLFKDHFYYHLKNEQLLNLPNDKEYDIALGKYTDYITVDDISQDYTIYGAIVGNASAYLLDDDFETIDAICWI